MADTNIARAKVLLTVTGSSAASPWSALAAAALAATAAVLMAGVVVLGPGVRFDAPSAGVGEPTP